MNRKQAGGWERKGILGTWSRAAGMKQRSQMEGAGAEALSRI